MQKSHNIGYVNYIKKTEEAERLIIDGKLRFFDTGSERGYISKKDYPKWRFCGVVRRGFRSGLYKFQLSGLGGPHRNSKQYVTNVYYKEV